MSRLEHERVMGLLAEAMELPQQQRRTFLDSTCAGAPELRRELEELLRYVPAAGEVFDAASSRFVHADTPPRIGHYRILEPLGEGGMAVVYKAYQLHPVRRTVAIKLIKLGMDTRQFVARFESERQALAMMDHPNVARVIDAGSTDTGRPYFVMEYVPGRPILQYCDARQLTVRQRLELFAHVCDAVEHAHRKGIIHRDIKNTNVLVPEVDGTPVPKVIDFGVAKAVTQPLDDRALQTEVGQLIGTPECMSPEQALSGGSDVDTRSDVYSLGVLLYELVTGAPPIARDVLRGAGYEQVRKIVGESDPPRPGARVASLAAEEAARVADARGTSAAALIRELRHELEWVPLKAMRKDREQRYGSAGELADDLRNALAHRPLRAGPETVRYRLGKFVRRHRAPVLAGAAVAVALLIGAVVSGVLAVQLKRQADAARAGMREAEAANADAQAVIEFLTGDVIGGADPAVTRGRELSVREAVDRAAASVAQTFRDRPRVEAAVREALALTYRALGRTDDALPHARAALELRQGTLGPDHPDALGSTATLASLLRRQGNFSQAEPLYRDVLLKRRALLGEDDRRTLSALSDLALVLQEMGDLDQAEPVARQAVEGYRRVLGNDHGYTLTATNNLALLLHRRGKLAEAEPLYREVLAARRKLLGDDHPTTLISINNLSGLLQDLGRLDEAEPLAREAAERSRAVLGPDHPNTLVALNNLVALLGDRHRFAEAEPLAREVVAQARRLMGDNHPQTVTMIRNLSGNLRAQGKTAEADQVLRRAASTAPAD